MHKNADRQKQSSRPHRGLLLFCSVFLGVASILLAALTMMFVTTAIHNQYNETDANAIVYKSFLRALIEPSDELYTNCAYNEHIYCEGTISKLLLETVSDTEALLPEDTVDDFVADGWCLVITTARDLTTYAAEQGCATQGYEITGLTDYNNKTIYIKAETDAITRSLLHEYGHYEDYRCGWVSNSDEFQNHYEYATSDTSQYMLENEYACISSKELFASLFNDNCLNNKSNIEMLPQAHDFVENATDPGAN